MTALALREDQDYWDGQQLAVLEQSGIAPDVTKPELAAFLHVCQRTGLDPFARQIYLIGRWDSKAGREVYRPQTGIDGYRIVAQRTCERTGQTLGYEDTRWCGADGEWMDVWLDAEPPAAAKVTVLRDGKRFPAIARWSEYVPLNKRGQITGLWGKRNAAQLEKCAEALALRKAFPNDMAGVYTAEEMEQADNPQRVHAVAEPVHDEPAKAAQGPEPAGAVPEPGTATARMTETPADDPWYTPEPAQPATDTDWMDQIGEDIDGITGREDGTRVWAKIVAAFNDGICTPDDRRALEGLVTAKMAAVMNQQTAATEPAEGNEAA